MPDETQIMKRQSVQDLPDVKKDSGFSSLWAWSYRESDGLLPAWGTRQREEKLRQYYRSFYGTLIQGAFAGLLKRIVSTPWEVEGPKAGVERYQDFLRHAQFGQGWRQFLMPMLLDYLRHDIGGFAEVIGPGNPMRAMTGPATGLAYLDALHCWPTGDPEYPVIYVSRKGQKHILHKTRVLRFVDMPDSDEDQPGGIGLCALSRSMMILERQILMGRYIEQRLDDKPPPGIMLARNMTEQQRNQAAAAYHNDQQRDARPIWGRTLWFYGLQVEHPIELTPVEFSKPPEGFDYRVYTVDIDVPMLALAIGIDPQDIWPLTGSTTAGTATQSSILHAKGRGKTFSDILSMLERDLNDVLPKRYEFQFKFSDGDQDKERADFAATWTSTVNQMDKYLTPDEARRLLANQIEPVKDVITDEDGTVLRLGDADPKDPATADDMGTPPMLPGQQVDTAPASETIPVTGGEPVAAMPTVPVAGTAPVRGGGSDTAAPVNIDSTQGLNGAQIAAALQILAGVVDGTTVPSVAIELLMALGIEPERSRRMVEDTVSGAKPKEEPPKQAPPQFNKPAPDDTEEKALKDFGGTRAEFVANVADLVASAQAGSINRRRFGIVLRAQLRRLGQYAFLDGREDGGVDRDEPLDDREQQALAVWLSDQNQYIGNFAQRVFGNELSGSQIEMHSEMWANKSLRGAFQLGQASAAWNAPFRWVYGDTEHCADCLRLNGQVHRMRDWRKRNLLPGSSALACHGYNCKCQLVPAPGEKSRGRF